LSYDINYKKVLNPAQWEAVMTLEGPVLVIAGAGSGKTRTLVYRVARLMETGVPPENVLLLTFTRKAAGEMLERAARLADERCRHVPGGTFHSLAYRVLRENANLLNYKSTFSILDRSDMEEVIQSLVRDMQIDRGSIRFPKRATLASVISKSVNLELGVEDLIKEEYSQFLEYMPEMKRLAHLYGSYKKENQLMDYDDLILLFRKILSQNEALRDRLSQQYRYIMVDEYQDTNGIQADIVKWLAHRHHNIMVVGDDSQSIYSFRGANYKNMFDFPKMFPETKTIKLEENYRSTQPILTFTNALMDQAEEKYTKCLFTKRADGELPRVVDTMTEPEQAMFICRSIKEQMDRGRSINDVAVLFSAAYHSFELEVELARQGITFVKYGGFKFMESAHIKDLLSHLRVVANKDDTISWGRILRLVKNIGPGKSQAITEWMKSNNCQPWQVDQWPEARKGDNGLKALTNLMHDLSAPNMGPGKSVERAIEYYEPILRERFDDFPRRRKDLDQMISMARRYRRLGPFLDDLVMEPPNSTADLDTGTGKDRLILSTVHSAKGLEWSIVYVIWVMEGYFPSSKAYSTLEDMEEERRMMYVAATRAKDLLFFCYPSQESPRAWQLAEMSYRSGLSSFIQGLPDNILVYESPGAPWKRRPVPSPRKEPRPKRPVIKHPSGLLPGDRVKHPAFGQGVISKFKDQEKVEVLFRDVGRKMLHLGYTSLEKI
jgi:DNA helicase-2/ATP-dependent DNA helicase PcrA